MLDQALLHSAPRRENRFEGGEIDLANAQTAQSVAVTLATGAISQEHGLGGEVDGGVAIAFLGDFFI